MFFFFESSSFLISNYHNTLKMQELNEIGEFAVASLLMQSQLKLKQGELLEAYELAQEIMQWSWERLHQGIWREVPLIWRNLYSIGALVCVVTNNLPL